MLLALQAGANGIPFTPVVGFLNSDYLTVRRDFKRIKDPYSGTEYVAVPALVPDVAVIHAFQGDPSGAVVTDSFRNDRLLAMAARKTIAIVEELVDPDDLLPGRHGVYVASVHIDAIVVAPHGAHPTACRGRYDIDAEHIMRYLEAARNKDSYQVYLEKYITGPEDHEAYLEIVKGDAS
ncbi:MAG TPA: hypothetical protein ENN34_07180 [Deltaproteobacteria bacterium]|nr:hypothetical protein [Deltaproteobacteria bacterium]